MIAHLFVPAEWIGAFARASAFAATAPIAGSGVVPPIVRGALALTLATAVVASSRHGGYIAAWPEQVVVGATFGVTAAIVASAAAAGGSLIDSALAMRPFGHDSVFGGGQGPIGRLLSLAFAALFFSTGAMTHLCSRFVEASSSAMHVMSSRGAIALVAAGFEASLDFAAPAIAAQLIATLAAAGAARAAPRINGLMLASPAATVAVLVVVVAGVAPAFRALTSLASLAASASPR